MLTSEFSQIYTSIVSTKVMQENAVLLNKAPFVLPEAMEDPDMQVMWQQEW